MDVKTVWQQDSNNPENGNNFDTIRLWWQSIGGQEVTWQQRLLPASGDPGDIDWETQRFDEAFLLLSPEIRGITLYWRRMGTEEERSMTARKAILDNANQCAYVYSQSQENLIVRIGVPQVSYQAFDLVDPELDGRAIDGSYHLTLRDAQQQVEVKVILNAESLYALKKLLP